MSDNTATRIICAFTVLCFAFLEGPFLHVEGWQLVLAALVFDGCFIAVGALRDRFPGKDRR